MGLGESDTPEALERFLKRNPGLSLLVERQGRLLGAVLCGHDGRRGFLHHLAVEASSRKQGIGSALVDSCLAGLRKEGIHKCNLFLYVANVEGRKFWEAQKWKLRDDLVLVQKTLTDGSATGCDC